MLKIGEKAPDFSLQSSTGDTVSLGDFRDKNYLVLIFYPGDETPGCTKQLCAIRDDFSDFEAKNAKVFGVNPADQKSHAKFVERYSFQFPLLIDKGGAITKKYGSSGGMMVKRTVYVINPTGEIIFAMRGMPTNEEILNSIPGKSE